MLVFLKNFLAFLAGGVAGVMGVILYAWPLLEAAIKKDVGLGIIIVAPVIFMMYAIVFGTLGGVAGVLVYNGVKLIKRKWYH